MNRIPKVKANKNGIIDLRSMRVGSIDEEDTVSNETSSEQTPQRKGHIHNDNDIDAQEVVKPA